MSLFDWLWRERRPRDFWGKLRTPTKQEDADAVGLSLLSGAHLTLFPRVMEELRSRKLGEILIFGGGVIPEEDIATLKQQGVGEIFGPGSSLKTIAEWLEVALDNREKATM